jgi:O-antigen/teichoic acid export membrane protein
MKDSTKYNVLYSILGVFFNAIVPIIVFPYVSRVLGVEAIGKYNFYSSGQQYLGLIVAFGVTFYGVREISKYKNDKKRFSLLYIELMIINIIAFFIAMFGALYCIVYTKYQVDSILILTFCIPVFFGAIGPDWMYIGLEKQRFLLIRNIIFKIISVVLIFSFVKSPSDLYIYICIIVFSVSAPSFVNLFLLRKHLIKINLQDISLYRHLVPMASIFIVEILVRFLGLGDILILGDKQGNSSVGYYTMAYKIILMCVSVLNITATALLPRASAYIHEGNVDEFNKLTDKTFNLLLLVGIPISFLLYMNAVDIIKIMGGNAFLQSAAILKALSFSVVFVSSINMFIFQVLYSKSKTHIIIVIYSIAVLLNITLNLYFVPIANYWGTLYAYWATLLLVLILLVLYNKETNILSFFSYNNLKIFFAGIISVLPALIFKYVFVFQTFFIIDSFLYISIYGCILFILKENYITSLFFNYLYMVKKNK